MNVLLITSYCLLSSQGSWIAGISSLNTCRFILQISHPSPIQSAEIEPDPSVSCIVLLLTHFTGCEELTCDVTFITLICEAFYTARQIIRLPFTTKLFTNGHTLYLYILKYHPQIFSECNLISFACSLAELIREEYEEICSTTYVLATRSIFQPIRLLLFLTPPFANWDIHMLSVRDSPIFNLPYSSTCTCTYLLCTYTCPYCFL